MSKRTGLIICILGVIALAGYGAYRIGVATGERAESASTGSARPLQAGDMDPETGKPVLYWHDPMVPGQRFDRPGKSPFMNMDLVPVYEEAGTDGSITIDPRVQQNLGIRVAAATLQQIPAEFSAVGSVDYNERDVAVVQTRAAGYIEQLHVRATLDPVRAGQPLVDLYVPTWVAAQEEYLSVRRMQSADLIPGVLDSARQRMRLVGMTDAQIAAVEANGEVQARLTLRAPIDGVVAQLDAREGMTVAMGAPLFRINGIETVWVIAAIPENMASQVRAGQRVTARIAALPGSTFEGEVSALLTEVDTGTRTLKARVELANPERQLVPGMFATLQFAGDPGEAVRVVPSEAIIRTGTRTVVMLAEDSGRFRSVPVEIGRDRGMYTEVISGLEPGQRVVVSGQFLIDSEASLRATESRFESSDAPARGTSAALHRGTGEVTAITDGQITINHGPIPSLQWGPMTMGFTLALDGVPANVAVGDRVEFDLRTTDGGAFAITRLVKLPAGEDDQ